jgi:hypothetical protein
VDTCAIALDGQTIVAGDGLGRAHFLRLVEADETKPASGDAGLLLNPVLVAIFRDERGKALREPWFQYRRPFLFRSHSLWFLADILGLFSNNVGPFSSNVVLKVFLFSANPVPKQRMLLVRAVYVLRPLQILERFGFGR